jgi:hypothetical protein
MALGLDTIQRMNGAGSAITAALVVVTMFSSCRRGDRRLDTATLPRTGITVAQRALWRDQLRWTAECEAAFRASHAGDGGGVEVVELGSGMSLVEVTCAAGAYQPSVLRFTLTDHGTDAGFVPLSFPVYASDDGRTLRLAQETEVWGDSAVSSGTSEIAILTLARQTGDCGVWARYSLTAGQPRLVAAAARVRCPDAAGPRATLSPSNPPAGWDPIPGKD